MLGRAYEVRQLKKLARKYYLLSGLFIGSRSSKEIDRDGDKDDSATEE